MSAEQTVVVVGAGHVAAALVPHAAPPRVRRPRRPDRRRADRPLPAADAVQGAPGRRRRGGLWLLDAGVVRGQRRHACGPAPRSSGSTPPPPRCSSPTAAASPPTSSSSPPAAAPAGCPASRATGCTPSARSPTATGCASGWSPGAASASSAAASSAPRSPPPPSARGAEAVVFDRDPLILARGLGADIGTAVQALHAAKGVQFRLGRPIESIEATADGVTLTTAAGTETVDDLVVCIGIEPNTEVAVRSGLVTGNGVEVDAAVPHLDPHRLRRRRRRLPRPPALRPGAGRARRRRPAAGRRDRQDHRRQAGDVRRPALVLDRPVRRQHPGPRPRRHPPRRRDGQPRRPVRARRHGLLAARRASSSRPPPSSAARTSPSRAS